MILFMWDIKDNKKQIIKYFIITIGTGILSFIYELFSHEVYSPYMIYSFLIPLLGMIIYMVIYFTKASKFINKISMELFNCSILTFTLYSILNGILEIYGTTNYLVAVYLKIGVILVIFGIIINISYNLIKKEGMNNEKINFRNNDK